MIESIKGLRHHIWSGWIEFGRRSSCFRFARNQVRAIAETFDKVIKENPDDYRPGNVEGNRHIRLDI